MSQQGSILTWVLVVGVGGWAIWTYALPSISRLMPEPTPLPDETPVQEETSQSPVPVVTPRLPRPPRPGAAPSMLPTAPPAPYQGLANWLGFGGSQESLPVYSPPTFSAPVFPTPLMATPIYIPPLPPATPLPVLPTPAPPFVAQVESMCQELGYLCPRHRSLLPDICAATCQLCNACL